jgi:hypothetical protein
LAANASSQILATRPSFTVVPGFTHIEITESSFESDGVKSMSLEECTDNCTYDCDTEGCDPVTVPVAVPTATGFENTNTDQNGQTTSPLNIEPASNTNIGVTRTLLVFGIHSSVAPTAAATLPTNTKSQPAPNAQSVPDNQSVPEEQSTQTLKFVGPDASEAATSDGFLADIINVITLSDLKPSDPNSSQLFPGDSPQPIQQGTAKPSMTAAPGVRPTGLPVPSLTVGGATLILTPGLSTTVGTNPTATYIEIASGDAGQMIIRLSSKGTALTATVTNAAAIMTVATNLDVSGISTKTSGGLGSSSIIMLASASSTAEAVDLKDGTGWMVHIITVMLGMAVAL